MEAFEHILGRYVKQETDDRVLTACLVAWATNTGLSKMGEISDIGYHTLAAISDSFIRLETLQEANDRISNAMAELPIFQYYNIGETIHSSSDGQKFETQIHTINARYSPKYFGLKKGVVSYTLVANHIPVNVKIISANEHESHYVFDILFNNTTQIQPEVHSTDTHGTNEVNSTPLRSNVQKALNRGENYHQLRRAVSYANFGKLRFKTEYEQQIWNECSRLITNCIIYYNATILSTLLSLKERTGDTQETARLKQISPIAWQHINLQGRYEFTKQPEKIDLNTIIQELAQ